MAGTSPAMMDPTSVAPHRAATGVALEAGAPPAPGRDVGPVDPFGFSWTAPISAWKAFL
jgi:hypothetical protein